MHIHTYYSDGTIKENNGIIVDGNLTVSGTGSLELDADYYGIYCDDYFDEAIDDYVEGSLMIQSGTLLIDADDAINVFTNRIWLIPHIFFCHYFFIIMCYTISAFIEIGKKSIENVKGRQAQPKIERSIF